ncbi:hypothetical protein NX059_012410 [Plenodomus lindquistii]|nr:hypothetical protein NX059_012410 [Plenodomus lindquistii]
MANVGQDHSKPRRTGSKMRSATTNASPSSPLPRASAAARLGDGSTPKHCPPSTPAPKRNDPSNDESGSARFWSRLYPRSPSTTTAVSDPPHTPPNGQAQHKSGNAVPVPSSVAERSDLWAEANSTLSPSARLGDDGGLRTPPESAACDSPSTSPPGYDSPASSDDAGQGLWAKVHEYNGGIVPDLNDIKTASIVCQFLGSPNLTTNLQRLLDSLEGDDYLVSFWTDVHVANLRLLHQLVRPHVSYLDQEQMDLLQEKARHQAVPEGHVVVSQAAYDNLRPKPAGRSAKASSSSGTTPDPSKSQPAKRATKVEQWWKRFDKKTVEDLVLTPGIEAMLRHKAVENWSSTLDPLVNPASASASAPPLDPLTVRSDLLSSRIKFISAAPHQGNVQNILLNIFFYWYADRGQWDPNLLALLKGNESPPPSPGSNGSAQTKPTRAKKLPTLREDHYKRLFDDFAHRYPDFTMTKAAFRGLISKARDHGR